MKLLFQVSPQSALSETTRKRRKVSDVLAELFELALKTESTEGITAATGQSC